jgi:hypothetical protein
MTFCSCIFIEIKKQYLTEYKNVLLKKLFNDIFMTIFVLTYAERSPGRHLYQLHRSACDNWVHDIYLIRFVMETPQQGFIVSRWNCIRQKITQKTWNCSSLLLSKWLCFLWPWQRQIDNSYVHVPWKCILQKVELIERKQHNHKHWLVSIININVSYTMTLTILNDDLNE